MDKREAFVKKYAAIYEHSPWIAEAAYDSGDIGTVEKIHAAMKAAVESAGYTEKITLIRAHPDLACAPATKLTQESVSEQKGAGLDRCTPEEYAEFQKLNADYKKKFGFPFIIAVKGLSRQDILVAFRQRIDNGAEKEFHTALEQIHKIARFRLEAMT